MKPILLAFLLTSSFMMRTCGSECLLDQSFIDKTIIFPDGSSTSGQGNTNNNGPGVVITGYNCSELKYLDPNGNAIPVQSSY